MRIATLFSIVVAASLSLVACGPGTSGDDDGDDGDDQGDDAQDPDASDQQVTGIGAPCTPDGADPMGQGSCGAGEVCLSLMGGTGPWCSKTCTPSTQQNPTADTCNQFVSAEKGLGYCYLGVDFDGANMGNPPVNFCGIICSTTTTACSGAGETCDGTCPLPLACTAPLMDGTGATVAQGCQ